MSEGLRETVRVTAVLEGGMTRVLVEASCPPGRPQDGITWDLPTHLIPPRLRGVGSRFVVVLPEDEESGEVGIEAAPGG
jgi:hypothetical protein